ncbi:unnamed protein product [Darwinula stevensoni]|uniref:Fatty acid hydroxylase domain-containing protein n=1 Tax=Darwinula stevensoni TaxID=69355 RepID=A0A7R9FT49_9CRUS|nr:unnamed protein product [Darwinula stevensoni]CAG0904682.1 unnamed protein product [Darwinula stevensoni]
MQLNTLYQIWLHTETVSSLGPLEYIMNTPSHHRVHHGSNRYCIDKNYAGALIIWDRIFGTFEPEGDQVVYGLTHPVSTYNPIKLQFHHFQSIWESLWKMESWGDRLKVLFYGPGWEPGQPRLYPKDLLPDVSYIPIALLGVPPSHFLVHMQLNTLYQIWLHTETVSSLGPLEYIINTPSHHRVHHGSNRYCIDKNYAGALIIWDRIFGTFEPEGDQVVYGLTHPVSTYNPIKLQFHHFQSIWESLWKMESWGDRLKVLFYGPGWEPGQPRLYPKDLLPDNKTPMQKYQPKSPWHLQVHAVMLFLIGGMMHAQFVSIHKTWYLHQALLFLGYMVLSIQSLGLMLKNDTQGPRVELLRCLVSAFLVLIFPFMDVWPLKLFTWVSGFHAIIWALKKKQKQLR